LPANTIAVPRLSMLDRQQCEVIHHASLEILRRTAARVYHEGALKLLRQADAQITDGNLVHFPAALVEWALRQAPSRIPLCRRGTGEPAAILEAPRIRNIGHQPQSEAVF
jgi:trimethylamine--corrinoid protein Co-methyltransferase